MQLLAIVAHPDDASMFCGGTLAKHSRRGDDVHVAYMTRGSYGGGGDRAESGVAEQRVKEAREAGTVLGVSTSFLGFKDGRIEYSLENRRKITNVIRNHHADLLLTHDVSDDHPDHRLTARLVQDAFYQASLPLAQSEHAPCDPDNVFRFGKPESGFEPDFYVDITEEQSTKEDALECHTSQAEFLEEHGGLDRRFDDLLEDVRAQARVNGRRCGVRFAEGFNRFREQPEDYLE